MSEDEQDQIIGNLLRQHRESQHRVGYCRAKAVTIQRIIPAILGAIADQQPLPNPRPAWPTPEEIFALCRDYEEARAQFDATKTQLADCGYPQP